jgi:Cytochrome c7 and related cytochrome c
VTRRLIRMATIIGIFVGALASGAHSQNLFEKLVLPGPLVEGHARFENDCGKCHEPFTRKSQTNLCLACHKDIAADRSAGQKLHGRRVDAAKQDCSHCHGDHLGRGADIVQFDKETFNHAVTNFVLRDAHVSVACGGCHAASAKFRSAPGQCVDCHKAADPHKGRLGERCDKCHDEVAWRHVKPFDHGATRFSLHEAHRAVSCSACHGGERYSGIGTACVSCHQIQDAHAGRYGAKCESCHAESKWTVVRFNHDKDTRYPLRGSHATVKCDSCHTGDLYRDKLATTCISCHRKDDRHKGQLGGKCEQCHSEVAWRRTTPFDHELTRFPLIGKHAAVACEGCHRSPDFKSTPLNCAGCHRDKHHEGRLGTNCGLCHNSVAWKKWRFDHDAQTKYPLTGAHRGLNCDACHVTRNVSSVVAPTDCYSCHRQDDAHQGSFGRACERCHSTISFKQVGRRP